MPKILDCTPNVKLTLGQGKYSINDFANPELTNTYVKLGVGGDREMPFVAKTNIGWSADYIKPLVGNSFMTSSRFNEYAINGTGYDLGLK